MTIVHLLSVTDTMLDVFVLDNLPPGAGGNLGAASTIFLRATLYAPIEDVIVLEPFTNKEVTEQLPQVRVIGFVIETKCARVVEEDAELRGEAAAEEIGGRGHLLLHDSVVLLLLGSSLLTLPGESTAEEVHENISERLQIVPASLLNPKVGVDGGVARSARQVLVLSVRDVKVRLRVPVLLGQAEIDDVDLVATLPNAHQEVVGLDVAVNEVARVDVLDPRNLKQGLSLSNITRE